VGSVWLGWKRKEDVESGKEFYLERNFPVVEVDYDDFAQSLDALGILLEHLGSGVFEI